MVRSSLRSETKGLCEAGCHVPCGEVRNPFLKAGEEDTLGPGRPQVGCGEHSHNLQWPESTLVPSWLLLQASCTGDPSKSHRGSRKQSCLYKILKYLKAFVNNCVNLKGKKYSVFCKNLDSDTWPKVRTSGLEPCFSSAAIQRQLGARCDCRWHQ